MVLNRAGAQGGDEPNCSMTFVLPELCLVK